MTCCWHHSSHATKAMVHSTWPNGIP
jgi:hypothetical protein